MKHQTTMIFEDRPEFPSDYRDWRDLPASFDEHRLEICGHAVIENWERGYMRRLAEIAVSKSGRILEVGFGMGLSAAAIQTYAPEEHVIIEANAAVFESLLQFARAYPSVTPILGFWQEVTSTLLSDSFSSILFDTYPLSAEEVHRNHLPFFREAYRLLKPGGVFTYYSDEEREFSPEHLDALKAAGFTDIQGEVCPVRPPAACTYWHSDTILAPIVFK